MKDAIIERKLRPTIPENLPEELKKLIIECFSSDPDERPYFTDIIPRLCRISGLKEPKSFTNFHYIINPNNNNDNNQQQISPLLPSKSKFKTKKLVVPKQPGEFKKLVSLYMSIPFQQKIRCILIHGNNIWIAGEKGILSRIGCDGNIKKTLIIHKDATNNNNNTTSSPDNSQSDFLDIHSLVGYENFIWGGCENGFIIIWDIKTLKEVTRWNAHNSSIIKNLSVVMTNKNIATIWSASPIDRVINVWNSNDFKLICSVSSNRHPVYCLTQHKDFIWVGGNGDLFLYNATNYQLRGSWRAHESSVSCILSFGNRVWTGSATGDIKIWEDKVIYYCYYYII